MTPGDRQPRDVSTRTDGNEHSPLSAPAPTTEARASRTETVAFESHGGQCEADLHLPTGREQPGPAVVMAHGFGGARSWGLGAFAERFAEAGLAAFVFDYRHLGGSSGTPRRLIDADRQLDDWAAALAFTRALDVVDANRVALWGMSFGGGHALEIARRDTNIAAVVAQVPFVDGSATIAHQSRSRGSFARARLAALAIADRFSAAVERGPIEVPIVTEPGEGGLLDTPGAFSGFRSVVPAGEQLVNRTPARVVLDLHSYRPGRHADQIDAPVHVVVAENDRLLPLAATERLLDHLPDPYVHRVPARHFDVHHEPWFEPVVDEQVAFLADAISPDP